MNSADELFVYGTLRPERAPAEIADVVRLVGGGTVQGRLLELGGYPGLVGGEGRVSAAYLPCRKVRTSCPNWTPMRDFESTNR